MYDEQSVISMANIILLKPMLLEWSNINEIVTTIVLTFISPSGVDYNFVLLFFY